MPSTCRAATAMARCIIAVELVLLSLLLLLTLSPGLFETSTLTILISSVSTVTCPVLSQSLALPTHYYCPSRSSQADITSALSWCMQIIGRATSATHMLKASCQLAVRHWVMVFYTRCPLPPTTGGCGWLWGCSSPTSLS